MRWVFIPLTDWVWFPHRYDISWTDDPNIVAIRGTYPLGEQRTLLFHTDPEQRSGRPKHRTAPAAASPDPPHHSLPGAAVARSRRGSGAGLPAGRGDMGRVRHGGHRPMHSQGCRDRRGLDVERRCRATTAGHPRTGTLWPTSCREIEDAHEVEGTYYKATFGEESRVNGWTYIRDMKWVGYWPGASMIHLEWALSYPQRGVHPRGERSQVPLLQHFLRARLPHSRQVPERRTHPGPGDLGLDECVGGAHRRWHMENVPAVFLLVVRKARHDQPGQVAVPR